MAYLLVTDISDLQDEAKWSSVINVFKQTSLVKLNIFSQIICYGPLYSRSGLGRLLTTKGVSSEIFYLTKSNKMADLFQATYIFIRLPEQKFVFWPQFHDICFQDPIGNYSHHFVFLILQLYQESDLYGNLQHHTWLIMFEWCIGILALLCVWFRFQC